MRRLTSNGYSEPTYNQQPSANFEEENEELVEGLRSKVSALKSLTIDIGSEVRGQNQFLKDMDDDFDKSHGFLSKTMNRVTRMAKAGHNSYILYLILFSFFVFFVIYVIIRFK